MGSTVPPLPDDRIFCEIPCKKNYEQVLRVQNSLNEKQYLKVKTELISPLSTKSLYRAQGLDNIELLPNSVREYKWTIYVINEGQYEFKVRRLFYFM